MAVVYIGIGGNLGDTESFIGEALLSLDLLLGNLKCSSFYKTEPRDYYDQGIFLNVVVRGETEISPFELLKATQSIEMGGGRVRDKKIPKGPRTIDLDLLLYGNELINEKQLIIPHPSMTERRFVLIPLLELSPNLVNPVDGKNYSGYLKEIEKQGVYSSSLKVYNNFFL